MTVTLSKLNFRDLGGLTTVAGETIKRGMIYRSEGPASFLAEHHAELSALGFRTVCDLRSEVERKMAPHDWCGPDCRILHLDMQTDLRAQGWQSMASDPSPDNARSVMTENYRLMPEALLPHLPAMMGVVLADELPMMVHCTAGKDRTGTTIGLLLALLGVSRADIFADYAKSDVFGQNMRIAGSVEDGFRKSFGFVPEEAVIRLFIGTEEVFLMAAFESVERQWGSVQGYFSAGGIGPAQQEKIRRLLLEPPVSPRP